MKDILSSAPFARRNSKLPHLFTKGVHIRHKGKFHQYDIGIKGKGHIYLKSMLLLVMQTPSFFD